MLELDLDLSAAGGARQGMAFGPRLAREVAKELHAGEARIERIRELDGAGRGLYAFESTEMDVIAMGAAWVIVGGLGYWVQTRLYRDGALSKASYGIVVGVGSFVLLLGTSMLR